MKLTTTFERQRNSVSGPVRRRPIREKTMPAVSPAARKLALAHYIDRLIERGVIADYTHAARMLGVSQARMSHLMGLLLLSPAIQEAMLLGEMLPRDKKLRELARVAAWEAQSLAQTNDALASSYREWWVRPPRSREDDR